MLICTRQGENFGLEQKVGDASEAFNEASGLCEKLLDQNPGEIVCRQGLASCHEKFGHRLVVTNYLDKGLADYQSGLTIRGSNYGCLSKSDSCTKAAPRFSTPSFG
jgi:hypothetical protein